MTQSYNENCGGDIVLHKLCDLINRLGREAYLYPEVRNFEFGKNNFINPIVRVVKDYILNITGSRLKLNKSLITPVLEIDLKFIDFNDWIVVYSETIFGNPLCAKNIVRWFLHNPGHHTGSIYYGSNELYFRYHTGIKKYTSSFSSLSDTELNIIHYPTDLYNEINTSTQRVGTAYCIRKGKGKKIVHDLSESILIDGKSHEEISNIFKRVKQFISYDTYTAYSIFSVLCGCESIIIPDENISEEEWMPDVSDRYGLAYGFENLEKSNLTKEKLISKILNEENRNLTNVANFIKEADKFFI